jgi:hypothetical protein
VAEQLERGELRVGDAGNLCAVAGSLGSEGSVDDGAAVLELFDDFFGIEEDESGVGFALLFEGGLGEAAKRDEVSGDGLFLATDSFAGDDAEELVDVVAADGFRVGLAFGDDVSALEAVVGTEVELATGLVDVEAGIVIAEGEEEIGGESREEVAKLVVLYGEQANRYASA